MKQTIKIGNSSGFWGDEPLAMRRQVLLGNLDYLTADYLAEVSMSILTKQQLKNPEKGYVADFIEHVTLSKDALKKHFPKIITNAGGMNPIACAKALQKVLHEMGFDKKVVAVTGDNLMGQVADFQAKGERFLNFETGEPLDISTAGLVSANVYTSSQGIVEALRLRADIVITGRASDSALTIAPCVVEFGWELDDWDKLAAGMIAGHALECGTQACGGNFTDWQTVGQWDEMGYPIVEISADGTFKVTKAEGTGGLVNQWTIKEQLIYEVGDPSNYFAPDVVADMSSISIEDFAENSVLIKGIKGKPSTETWKVSMAIKDGYKAVGHVVIGGENALTKAKLVNDIFWKRFPFSFDKQSTNYIGANALGESLQNQSSKEILLQFVAFDYDRSKLQLFSKEVAGLILAGPQGMAAYGGRAKIQEVIAYWPSLIDKSKISLKVWDVPLDAPETLKASFAPFSSDGKNPARKEVNLLAGNSQSSDLLIPSPKNIKVKMKELCLARSGDKGNTANLGVLARNKTIYDFFEIRLTTEVVKHWFKDQCKGEITRYKWGSLMGLNFVLEDVLDGGGTKSSRIDPQGKMLASTLLTQEIYVPKEIYNSLSLTNNL